MVDLSVCHRHAPAAADRRSLGLGRSAVGAAVGRYIERPPPPAIDFRRPHGRNRSGLITRGVREPFRTLPGVGYTRVIGALLMRCVRIIITGSNYNQSAVRAALHEGHCVLKGSPCSIAERRIPELIPVLGSQPAADVSHKSGGI